MNTKPIFIEGNRNGYSIDQCGYTMTVGELIAYLEDFDEDRPVFIRNDNDYTYGHIRAESIYEAEDLEEDYE